MSSKKEKRVRLTVTLALSEKEKESLKFLAYVEHRSITKQVEHAVHLFLKERSGS